MRFEKAEGYGFLDFARNDHNATNASASLGMTLGELRIVYIVGGGYNEKRNNSPMG